MPSRDIPAPVRQRRADADIPSRALRVTKKLLPGRGGTKKLLAQYGSALVCVRYRQDALKLYRYTTVELVVRAGPIRPARFDAATFGIELRRHEHGLRRALQAAGARWDPVERLWRLRGRDIRKLDLADRIVSL